MSRFYCRQEDSENCPYKLIDLCEPLPICNYTELFVSLMIDNKFSEIPRLVSKACESIRMEEGREKTIRRLYSKRFEYFLDNVKAGDVVFCRVAPFHEVKIIDIPLNDSGYVRCRAPNGKIIKVMAFHLFILAKGEFQRDYILKGAFSRKKALRLKNKANIHGFRVKIAKKSVGYVLKVYGDSQEQVDDFIFWVLESKLDLDRYLSKPII